MTRYYHFVNGMEMAVLAEATHQLHAVGYASTLDLVYSIAKQALDRLPPLYFSIKPLKQSAKAQAEPTQWQNENRALTQEQKRQMQGAVQQAIQAMMKQQRRLPHERWYTPSSWSDIGNGLPTHCYYG